MSTTPIYEFTCNSPNLLKTYMSIRSVGCVDPDADWFKFKGRGEYVVKSTTGGMIRVVLNEAGKADRRAEDPGRASYVLHHPTVKMNAFYKDGELCNGPMGQPAIEEILEIWRSSSYVIPGTRYVLTKEKRGSTTVWMLRRFQFGIQAEWNLTQFDSWSGLPAIIGLDRDGVVTAAWYRNGKQISLYGENGIPSTMAWSRRRSCLPFHRDLVLLL